MTKQKKSYFFLFAVVMIICVVVYQRHFFSVFDKIWTSAVMPVEIWLYQNGQSIKKIGQLRQILEENDYLKSEISKLSLDYIKLASLETENEYLKKELDFLQTNKYKYQLADVVSQQLYNSHAVFINKGSKQGIRENLPVTVAQGVVVGKIVSVTEERSEVLLLTDVNSELAVTLSQSPGTSGVVAGQAGGSLTMEFIPNNLEIKTGDLVVTSGLEENIPRGLLVGRVSDVENIIGEIFKHAKVVPPFDYSNIQSFTVIIPQLTN